MLSSSCGGEVPDNLLLSWRARRSAAQIAKANRATVEQRKADGEDPVLVSGDVSWLPGAPGNAELEDISEGQSEQDLEDKIQTTWSQVHRGLTKPRHCPSLSL